ncbi:hypothetical protein PVAND_014631 [Polypedilum vanderplanki]|uniref:Peptidase S1 domain-containing protein n=1 Tax=Polypedilum vanderplanki TaxID=319348 RepID=A0A9J6BAA6_POLVA|nr:hypothetical protein PVAND_014631 [Polypedilum vanderplanki]
MWKILCISLFLVVAASATPSVRHRYQLNEMKLETEINRGQGRIVGGRNTDITEVPHQVVLFFNRGFTCGGSIINTNTILSAAHCTYGRNHANFQILVGETNRNQGSLIEVSQVIQHEEYDDWELWNDVVILKIANHLTEGPTIHRVNLPTPGHIVPPGLTVVVSGFGDLQSGSGQFPQILQSVEVPAWSHQACVDIYPNEEIFADQHLCAGAQGRDACQGDSGGPLTENFGQHGSQIVIGVVSWGYSCAAQWPTVYARVSHFLPWIMRHY